jgi:hypothetical protein
MPRLSCSALVVSAVALSACQPERVPVDFKVPADEPQLGTKFLETPWPSDVMIREDGHLDLSTVPNPTNVSALEDIIRMFQDAPAYAASGTLYFHVDGGVEESSLPSTAEASLTPGASMFLVETATLHRIPIVWKQYLEGTAFLPPGTIAAQPLLGAVPRGRFALVVTANARSAKNDGALEASDDLRALMTCAPLPGGLRKVDCKPYQKLVEDLGLSADNVALIQMITPVDASQGLVDAAAVVRALPPPTFTVTGKRAVRSTDTYVVYDGTVSLAQFQSGAPPYDDPNAPPAGLSGGFVLDDEGQPVVQRFEDVRFVLTVPRTPRPPGGYCVVINGHGTGGDLESGLGNGPSAEAFQIASANCAMLAVSEPLHRTRDGYREGQEEILTFNFFNPRAGRDNWRQSALEKVQLVSLVDELTVPASITGDVDVTFDPARVSYFGHSQGGITGALFVAVEDRIQGAFLSGAGGGFQVSLVEKVDPVAIKDTLRAVLQLDDSEEIDLFHPVITLLQTWVDPADPINYGRRWRERRGHVPHLVATSGLQDTFTPPPCHAGLAGAFGLPLAKPVSKPLEVLDLLGIAPVGPVVQGDLESADGDPLTVAMLQYPDDGHFAVFDNPDAQDAMRSFFTSLQDGVPVVRVK